jgi:hypothetical protein
VELTVRRGLVTEKVPLEGAAEAAILRLENL